MKGGLTGLYHCRHTNYHCASRFYCVPFSTKLECSAEQLLAADPSYCWLYPSKQAVDCFILFVHLDCVLFSHLKRSVYQVLIAAQVSLPVLLVLTDYWSWGLWIIAQVTLTPGQTQVINWIVHDRWVCCRLSNNTDIRPCSNCPSLLTQHGPSTMICWLCWYSMCTTGRCLWFDL